MRNRNSKRDVGCGSQSLVRACTWGISSRSLAAIAILMAVVFGASPASAGVANWGGWDPSQYDWLQSLNWDWTAGGPGAPGGSDTAVIDANYLKGGVTPPVNLTPTVGANTVNILGLQIGSVGASTTAATINGTTGKLNIGTGGITVEAGSRLTINASVGGTSGLLVAGSGITKLSANNTFTGDVDIQPGATLTLGGFSAPGGTHLWLDSTDAASLVMSGSTVTAWKDKTGNGQQLNAGGNATTMNASGTLNGLPVVSFRNNSWLLNNFDYRGQDFTILAVGRMTGGDNERLISSNGNNWLFGWHGGTQDDLYAEGWVNDGQTGANQLPHLYEAFIPGTGNPANTQFYVYDAARPTITLINQNRNGTNAPLGFELGGWNGGGETSNGDVGEVLIYRSTLSAADRAAAENYLIAKWFGSGASFDNIPNTAKVTVRTGATFDVATTQETIGTLEGAGSVTIGSGGRLTFGGNLDNFTGTISGAGGIAKTGTALLTVNSNYTYGGGTTIHGGDVMINNGGALGTGPIIHNGGTMTLNRTDDPFIFPSASSTIKGTGALTKLNATVTYLNVDAAGLTGTLNVKDGTTRLGAGDWIPGLVEGTVGGGWNRDGMPSTWIQTVQSRIGGQPEDGSPLLRPERAYRYDATSPGTWWGTDITYVYKGQLYFPGNANGNQVRFEWHIDDMGYLRIDGQPWAGRQNVDWNGNDTAVLTPGWHNYEFRCGQGGGGAGPSGVFGWDPTGAGATVALQDPGDGSVFHTAPGGLFARPLGPIVMENSAVLDLFGNDASTPSITGTVNNEIKLSAMATLTVNQSGNATFAGFLTGDGNLVKSGAGTLTLDNPLTTYTGATTVNSGTLITLNLSSFSKLNLGSAGAAGTLQYTGGGVTSTGAINVLAGGGTLINAGGGALVFSGGVSGAGNLTVSGAATDGTQDVTLGGNVLLGTKTLIKQGASTLRVTGGANTMNNVVINGGNLVASLGSLQNAMVQVDGGAKLTLGSPGSGLSIGGLNGTGTVDLQGSLLTINSTTADSSFSGTLDDTAIPGGGLRKTGGNKFTLVTPQEYFGATTVNVGTFEVPDTGSIPFSDVTVSPNALLRAGDVQFNSLTLTGLARLNRIHNDPASFGTTPLSTLNITLNGASVTDFRFHENSPGNTINDTMTALNGAALAGLSTGDASTSNLIGLNVYADLTTNKFRPSVLDLTYKLIQYDSWWDGFTSTALTDAQLTYFTVLNPIGGLRYKFKNYESTRNPVDGYETQWLALEINNGPRWLGNTDPVDPNWSRATAIGQNWTIAKPAGDASPLWDSDVVAFGGDGANAANTAMVNDLTTSLSSITKAPLGVVQLKALFFVQGSGAGGTGPDLAYSIDGNPITLTGDVDNNVIRNDSTGTQTINARITLGANYNAIWANAGNITLGIGSVGGGVDNAGKILRVNTNPGRTVTINGPIDGSGGLDKTGTGALTLSAGHTHTYQGATTIGAGTFTVDGTLNPTGSATVGVDMAGSTVLAGTGVIDRPLNLLGSVTLQSAGTLRMGKVGDPDPVVTVKVGGGLNIASGTLTGPAGANPAGAVVVVDQGANPGLVLPAGNSLVAKSLTANGKVVANNGVSVSQQFAGSGVTIGVGANPITVFGSDLSQGVGKVILDGDTVNLSITGGLPLNPVVKYTFDSVAGNTINNEGTAGATRNATFLNNATVTTGGGGRKGTEAANFDNSGNAWVAVNLVNNRGVELGQNWTASAWFNGIYAPGQGRDWGTLWRANANDHIVIIENGSWRLGMYDNRTGTGFNAAQPQYNMDGVATGWHQITTVGSGSDERMYIDGNYVATVVGRKTIDDIYAIGNGMGWGQKFARKLDDVYIYDRALSDADVMALYTGGGVGGTTFEVSRPTNLNITLGPGIPAIMGALQFTAAGADLTTATPGAPGTTLSIDSISTSTSVQLLGNPVTLRSGGITVNGSSTLSIGVPVTGPANKSGTGALAFINNATVQNLTVSGGSVTGYIGTGGGATTGSTLKVGKDATGVTVAAPSATVDKVDLSMATGTVNATNPLAGLTSLKLPGGTSADLAGGTTFTAQGANLASGTLARTLTFGDGTLTLKQAGSPAGTVAWYKFDDPSNWGLDSVGGFNMSPVAGSPTVATDAHSGGAARWNANAAMQLSGAAFSSLAAQLPDAQGQTLIMWLKRQPSDMQGGGAQQNTSGIMGGLGSGSNDHYTWDNNQAYFNTFRNNSRVDGITTLSQAAQQQWHMISIVRNPADNTWKFYSNGVQAGSWGGAGYYLNNYWKIGQNESNLYWGGSMDDVMLVNRAMSAQELLDLYSTPVGGALSQPNTALVVTGTAGLDLADDKSDHTVGSLSLAAGSTLTVSNAKSATFGGIAVTGAGTATIAGSPIGIGAGQTINVAGQTLNITSAVAGPSTVNFIGGGTLNMTAANTYTGPTTANAGLLRGNLGATSSLTINNATVQATASSTISGGGAIGSPNAILQIDGSNVIRWNGPVAASGGGALSVPGPGTLLINGTFAAPVTVAGGTIGGIGNITGGLTIGSGVHVQPGGSMGTLSVGTMTFSPSGGDVVDYEIGSLGGSDRIATATLVPAASGQTSLNFTRMAGFAPGVYPLITFANGPANATGFTVGSLTGLTAANLRVLNNAIVADLGLDPAINPLKVWEGVGGDGTTWDTDNNANWQGPAKFQANDQVQFNDTAHTNVTVSGTQNVAAIVFNNSVDYTLGGSGVLADAAGAFGAALAKNGAGKLTIGNMLNTFSGGTAINQGTVAVSTLPNAGAAGPLGTGPLSIGGFGASGTLLYTGTDASPTSTRGVAVVGGGGTINVQNGTTNLTLSGVVDGAGVLTKNGPGTLTLSGQVLPTGIATVHNVVGGTLALTNTSTATPNNWNANTIRVAGSAILDAWGSSGSTTTNTLANATVQLDGGRLVARGTMPPGVQVNALTGRMYQNPNGGPPWVNFAAGTDALTTGITARYGPVIVTRTPSNNGGGDWNNVIPNGGQGDPNDFQAIFNGFFVPSQSGIYGFTTSADDYCAFALDLNGNGRFTDGGEATTTEWNAQPRPIQYNLTAGKMYRVAFGSGEWGGGDWAWWHITPPGMAEVNIDPSNPTNNAGTWMSSTQWDAVLSSTNLNTTGVKVTADSTLDVQSALGANFGPLTLKTTLAGPGKKLTVVNAAAYFSSTTFTDADDGYATIDSAVNVGLGTLNDLGTTVILTKTGAGYLVLNKTDAPVAFGANSTIYFSGASAGGLSMVGSAGEPGANPLGLGKVIIDSLATGVTLQFSAKSTAPVTFDNSLTIHNDAALIAGAANGGVPNGTVNLGPNQSVDVDSGKTVNISTSGGYQLVFTGLVNAGGATLNVAAGSNVGISNVVTATALNTLGTVNLNVANGINSVGMTTVSNAGVLNLGVSPAAMTNVTLDNGGSLRAINPGVTFGPGSNAALQVTGSSGVLGGGTQNYAISAPITMPSPTVLRKTGSETVTLNGVPTTLDGVTGTVLVDNGRLDLRSPSTKAGVLTVTGGALDVNADFLLDTNSPLLGNGLNYGRFEAPNDPRPYWLNGNYTAVPGSVFLGSTPNTPMKYIADNLNAGWLKGQQTGMMLFRGYDRATETPWGYVPLPWPGVNGFPQADNFGYLWTGFLTVPAGQTGQWQLWPDWIDDRGLVAVDLNRDGDFTDPGEFPGENQRGYFNLVEGEKYPVAFSYFEWGGGDCIAFWAQPASGGGRIVNPSDPNQAGWWSNSLGSGITLTGGAINVSPTYRLKGDITTITGGVLTVSGAGAGGTLETSTLRVSGTGTLNIGATVGGDPGTLVMHGNLIEQNGSTGGNFINLNGTFVPDGNGTIKMRGGTAWAPVLATFNAGIIPGDDTKQWGLDLSGFGVKYNANLAGAAGYGTSNIANNAILSLTVPGALPSGRTVNLVADAGAAIPSAGELRISADGGIGPGAVIAGSGRWYVNVAVAQTGASEVPYLDVTEKAAVGGNLTGFTILDAPGSGPKNIFLQDGAIYAGITGAAPTWATQGASRQLYKGLLASEMNAAGAVLTIGTDGAGTGVYGKGVAVGNWTYPDGIQTANFTGTINQVASPVSPDIEVLVNNGFALTMNNATLNLSTNTGPGGSKYVFNEVGNLKLASPLNAASSARNFNVNGLANRQNAEVFTLSASGSLRSGQTWSVTKGIIGLGQSNAVSDGALLNVNSQATVRFDRQVNAGYFSINAGGALWVTNQDQLNQMSTFTTATLPPNVDPTGVVRTLNVDPNAPAGQFPLLIFTDNNNTNSWIMSNAIHNMNIMPAKTWDWQHFGGGDQSNATGNLYLGNNRYLLSPQGMHQYYPGWWGDNFNHVYANGQGTDANNLYNIGIAKFGPDNEGTRIAFYDNRQINRNAKPFVAVNFGSHTPLMGIAAIGDYTRVYEIPTGAIYLQSGGRIDARGGGVVANVLSGRVRKDAYDSIENGLAWNVEGTVYNAANYNAVLEIGGNTAGAFTSQTVNVRNLGILRSYFWRDWMGWGNNLPTNRFNGGTYNFYNGGTMQLLTNYDDWNNGQQYTTILFDDGTTNYNVMPNQSATFISDVFWNDNDHTTAKIANVNLKSGSTLKLTTNGNRSWSIINVDATDGDATIDRSGARGNDFGAGNQALIGTLKLAAGKTIAFGSDPGVRYPITVSALSGGADANSVPGNLAFTRGRPRLTLPSPTAIAGDLLTSGTGTATIDFSTQYNVAGKLVNNGSVASTVDATVGPGGKINVSTTISGTGSFAPAGGTTLTLGLPITGAGSQLNAAGGGTVLLNLVSNHDGGTSTAMGGTLKVTTNGANLGTGPVVNVGTMLLDPGAGNTVNVGAVASARNDGVLRAASGVTDFGDVGITTNTQSPIIVPNTLTARWYGNNDANTWNNDVATWERVINFGAGTDALTTGRTPDDGPINVNRNLDIPNNQWNLLFPTKGGDPNFFMVIYNGTFTPSKTGDYKFYSSSDDRACIAMDLNLDGDFTDAGESTNVAWDTQPRPINFANLQQGVAYPVRIGNGDWGGGDWAWHRIINADGVDTVINPPDGVGAGNGGVWTAMSDVSKIQVLAGAELRAASAVAGLASITGTLTLTDSTSSVKLSDITTVTANGTQAGINLGSGKTLTTATLNVPANAALTLTGSGTMNAATGSIGNAGRLELNGSRFVAGALTGNTGLINVNGGGTMAGLGPVSVPVSLNAGGSLDAGDGAAGAMQVTNLSIAAGGQVKMAIGATSNGVVQAAGAVTIGGSPVLIVGGTVGATFPQYYDFMTGGVPDSGPTWGLGLAGTLTPEISWGNGTGNWDDGLPGPNQGNTYEWIGADSIAGRVLYPSDTGVPGVLRLELTGFGQVGPVGTSSVLIGPDVDVAGAPVTITGPTGAATVAALSVGNNPNPHSVTLSVGAGDVTVAGPTTVEADGRLYTGVGGALGNFSSVSLLLKGEMGVGTSATVTGATTVNAGANLSVDGLFRSATLDTAGTVNFAASAGAAPVGFNVTTLKVTGGTTTLAGAQTVNNATVSGGTINAGNGSITTLNITGGNNNVVSGGSVGTANISGGGNNTISGGAVTTANISGGGNNLISGGTVGTANISGGNNNTFSAAAVGTANISGGSTIVNGAGTTALNLSGGSTVLSAAVGPISYANTTPSVVVSSPSSATTVTAAVTGQSTLTVGANPLSVSNYMLTGDYTYRATGAAFKIQSGVGGNVNVLDNGAARLITLSGGTLGIEADTAQLAGLAAKGYEHTTNNDLTAWYGGGLGRLMDEWNHNQDIAANWNGNNTPGAIQYGDKNDQTTQNWVAQYTPLTNGGVWQRQYANDYSVEWKGLIWLDAKTYKFQTQSDDATAIWIGAAVQNPRIGPRDGVHDGVNDNTIINNNGGHGEDIRNSDGNNNLSFTAPTAGYYPFLVRMNQGWGGHGALVNWNNGDGSSNYVPIPISALVHKGRGAANLPATHVLLDGGGTANLDLGEATQDHVLGDLRLTTGSSLTLQNANSISFLNVSNVTADDGASTVNFSSTGLPIALKVRQNIAPQGTMVVNTNLVLEAGPGPNGARGADATFVLKTNPPEILTDPALYQHIDLGGNELHLGGIGGSLAGNLNVVFDMTAPPANWAGTYNLFTNVYATYISGEFANMTISDPTQNVPGAGYKWWDWDGDPANGIQWINLNQATGQVQVKLNLDVTRITSYWTHGGLNTNWSNTANWAPAGVPAAAGDVAQFDTALGSPNGDIVAVDAGGQTIGEMLINSANPYSISGSDLTLNNGLFGKAKITVQAGSHDIMSKLVLASDLSLLPAGGTVLTLGNIDESPAGSGKTVTVDNGGTVVMAGVGGFTGGLTVINGEVDLIRSDALAAGSPIDIRAAGQVVLGIGMTEGPFGSAAVHRAPVATSVSAVPEPGTLVLLAVGALAALGLWLRRKG